MPVVDVKKTNNYEFITSTGRFGKDVFMLISFWQAKNLVFGRIVLNSLVVDFITSSF